MDFICGPRYGDFSFLGSGAYGVVAQCIDRKTNQTVAIKKSRPFEHQTHAMRTLREVKILNRMQHENIINIIDLPVCATSVHDYKDVYMVMDCMETDLFKLLKAQPLTADYVCYFTYQILRGLKYIHSANVLHRDLKPSNLLLNRNCDLKICDFGLARTSDPTVEESFKTEYVATRWYRAPEVILNPREYTKAIDLWSVGCIVGEMFNRRPLFPGTHYIEQVNMIIDVVGTPGTQDIDSINNEMARSYLASLPFHAARDFHSVCPHQATSEEDAIEHAKAMDLMQKLLTFNPVARFDCEQALAHPYLAQYSDPEDEPTADAPFVFDEAEQTAPVEVLKEMLYRESVDRFGVVSAV